MCFPSVTAIGKQLDTRGLNDIHCDESPSATMVMLLGTPALESSALDLSHQENWRCLQWALGNSGHFGDYHTKGLRNTSRKANL